MSENIRNIAYSPILQIIMMTVFFAKSNELKIKIIGINYITNVYNHILMT